MKINSLTFKYGEVIFRDSKMFNDTLVRFTTVPHAYLAQEVDNPQKIYMFSSYKEMQEYFTKKSNGSKGKK
jgi:hypothetical protein